MRPDVHLAWREGSVNVYPEHDIGSALPAKAPTPGQFRPRGADLPDQVREDASRSFLEFLMVPTIRRYAEAVKPDRHPSAADEVVRQIAECCQSEWNEIQYLLSETHPTWSLALQRYREPELEREASRNSLLKPDECGPDLADGRPRFTIGPRITAGSSGVIHLAKDRCNHDEQSGTSERIIVKLLKPESAGDESWQEEAKLARAVGSPCGIRIIDSGIAPTGHGYIAMERVDGLTLFALAASEQMAPSRHVGIELAHLADALQTLHLQGLGHGDIHPANVMMDRAGNLRLLDYGRGPVASANEDVRSLCALSLWLTLGYMPPPGTTVPWQSSPMKAAIVKAAVDALNDTQTAGAFARSIRARMRRARIQRNTLTTLLMSLLLVVLLYIGATGRPSGPGASHAAATDTHQTGP